MVTLRQVAKEWGRIGCVGFGGPPAHIALLRELCVEREKWLTETEFEDAIAATNLLPGPASTQLAIFCAWRVRGRTGALVGGLCFIVPGLAMILLLASLFLSSSAPTWVRGAAAGAGAAVAAVAVQAAVGLLPGSLKRAGTERGARLRWTVWLVVGGVGAALAGPWLVLLLIGCGLAEAAWQGELRPARGSGRMPGVLAITAFPTLTAGTLAAVAWVGFKVGALSYGGGFVIIPLMQHDAVQRYHWMTAPQFLDAVALGQITPGPVVQTVAVVGFAAAGVWGGLLAAAVAFTPSFAFVLLGGSRFDRLRGDTRIRAFLAGAGPAAVGAIAGAAVPLAMALSHLWQVGVLAAAAVWLLVARRGTVGALLGAGALGIVAAWAGAPLS